MKKTILNTKAQRLKGSKIIPLCLCVFVSLCLMLPACVPAKEPDVLHETPGPSFTVTDETYSNAVFSLRYPSGWRLVTSEASVAPSVIFVAPDEISIIQIQVGTLDAANFSDPDKKMDVRGLTLANKVAITAILSAVPDSYDALLPIFEQVIASINAV